MHSLFQFATFASLSFLLVLAYLLVFPIIPDTALADSTNPLKPDSSPSLSLSTGGQTTANIVGVAPNGVAKTDSVTATVITNNPTGYHLTLSTNTNDNCLKPTSATDCSSASYKINSVSSTPTSPSVLNPNQWGVTLSTTFTNPDKGDDNVWFAVPNQSSPADIKTTPTATIGEATTLIFGSKADYSIPAGMYQGTTVITALPNSYTSPPAPTIANITPNTGLPAGNTPLLLLAQTLILLTKSLSTLTKRQPRRRRKLHQRQHRQCHPNHLHHAACHRRHL